MKFFLNLLFIIFLFSNCSHIQNRCVNNPSYSEANFKFFSKVLDSISNEYSKENIEFPYTLLRYPQFDTILNNPCDYKLYALNALSDNTKANSYKMIALFTLQHLCIDDYISVLKAVFSEYRTSKVDENFLMFSVSQAGFSEELCKNYNNINLRSMLKEILPTLKNNINVDLINDILSGKIWKDVNRYDKDLGNTPPWVCE